MNADTQFLATCLPDVSASWSNRNGGEVLLIGGSVRAVMSAAMAQSIVDKLSRALDVPKRAAAMATRDPEPERELERLADPDAEINEALRDRFARLKRKVPHRETRASAVREARALIAAEDAAFVMIAGIAFTASDVAEIERGMGDS